MTKSTVQMVFRQALGMVCILLLLPAGAILFGQEPPPPAEQEQAAPSTPALSPDQLADLVAPVALYPDSLLSQLLVAATYPLEVVEAGQWLQQNRNLRGAQLVAAARQQNWDPSIQALVVFPDVLTRLNSDIRWTTDLGNAFLAQQAGVMEAVQRLRARASQSGRLKSNSQESVTTQTQGGQTAIEIQPADPQVVYVPNYNPEYIWGSPAYGFYPPLYYPDIGFGFGFGSGIYIGGFFGGLGWGGWGWGPSWFGNSIYVNNSFFHRYGFNDFHGGGGFQGRGAWAHDSSHRLGVPYSNRALTNRYRGASSSRTGAGGARSGGQRETSLNRANPGGNIGNRGNAGANAQQSRSVSQQRGASAQRFGGSRGFEPRSSGGSHSAFGGVQSRGQTRQQSDHGYSSLGSQRTQPSRGGGSAPSHGGGSAPSRGGGSASRSSSSSRGGNGKR
ncbi:MAG: DUF3300 domain-containing protein [Bryobacteraceae bacterium]